MYMYVKSGFTKKKVILKLAKVCMLSIWDKQSVSRMCGVCKDVTDFTFFY